MQTRARRYSVGMADFKTATTRGSANRGAQKSARIQQRQSPCGRDPRRFDNRLDPSEHRSRPEERPRRGTASEHRMQRFGFHRCSSSRRWDPPHEHLDLPNIIPDVQKLTTGEFDAWVSGDLSGIYRPVIAAEMNERTQLEALHELLRTKQEAHRVAAVIRLEAELTDRPVPDNTADRWGNPGQQLIDAQRRIAELETLLKSGGWHISPINNSSSSANE